MNDILYTTTIIMISVNAFARKVVHTQIYEKKNNNEYMKKRKQ